MVLRLGCSSLVVEESRRRCVEDLLGFGCNSAAAAGRSVVIGCSCGCSRCILDFDMLLGYMVLDFGSPLEAEAVVDLTIPTHQVVVAVDSLDSAAADHNPAAAAAAAAAVEVEACCSSTHSSCCAVVGLVGIGNWAYSDCSTSALLVQVRRV